MRRLLTILALLVVTSAFGQQVAKQLTTQLAASPRGYTVGFLEYRPPDYGSQKHPCIIYLHGIGERGVAEVGTGTDAKSALAVAANDIPKSLTAPGVTMRFIVNCEVSSFVVVSPQLYAPYGSWQNWYVDEMLAYVKQNLNIDTNRIYLTGISLGGGGVWRYLSTSQANAAKFAAAAPVCGTCDWADLCNIARAQTPVWAFHASDDNVVGVGCTNSAVAALAACSPSLVAMKTIYPNGGHWIWTRAYDLTHAWHEPNLYEWFLMQKRTVVKPPEPAPAGLVANAGPDQTVTGSTATLDASASTGYGGDWNVSWSVVAQPAGSTWDIFPGYDKTGPKKALQKLVPGTYTLQVDVVDGKGGKASDRVVVTVR